MTMRKQDFTSFARVPRALKHSLSGLKHAASTEAAFQQELIGLAVLSVIALALPFSGLLKVLLMLTHLLVLIVELLNTAIEALADKICTDIDPLIKQAKDIGSAAVLLIFAGTTLVWGYALYTLL